MHIVPSGSLTFSFPPFLFHVQCSLKCLFDSYTEADVFYTILVAWSLVPIALTVACRLFWYAVARLRPGKVSNIPQKLNTSMVAVLYLIWPSLCSQTFSAFACQHVCELPGSFLRADINEKCFEGRHLVFALAVAAPMLFGYVLGLPLVALVATRRLQQRAAKRQLARTSLKGHQTWGQFYSSFRAETWWYVVAVVLVVDKVDKHQRPDPCNCFVVCIAYYSRLSMLFFLFLFVLLAFLI